MNDKEQSLKHDNRWNISSLFKLNTPPLTFLTSTIHTKSDRYLPETLITNFPHFDRRHKTNPNYHVPPRIESCNHIYIPSAVNHMLIPDRAAKYKFANFMAWREHESAMRLIGTRIKRADYSGRVRYYQIIACGMIPEDLSEPMCK
ncbi:unnamed protein product [Onchocerca flexuosa]|uniref:Uncharacterized protein n=1 Tax=Onchocerca flexuosa TaxID=387005 RepID=A0A183H9A5_9BILA|nr:unnamed protein product [Onchocerca flexuosa]